MPARSTHTPTWAHRAHRAVIDAWLAKQPKLKAVTLYERLVAEQGFDGHYQRVKVYMRENRDRLVGIPADPQGLHRRFEVLAGAQAQVDWGDEGELQTTERGGDFNEAPPTY